MQAHERSLHLNEPSTKNTMSINPKNILKSRAILVHRGCKIIKYLSALKYCLGDLAFWTPGICKPSSSQEQTSFSTESSSWEACELVLLVFSNLSFEKRCTRRVCVWDLGSRNPAGEPYKKLRKATNLGNLGYGFPAERWAFKHLQDTLSDAELRATCDDPVVTCCPPKTCTLNTWSGRSMQMFIHVYLCLCTLRSKPQHCQSVQSCKRIPTNTQDDDKNIPIRKEPVEEPSQWFPSWTTQCLRIKWKS